MATWHRRIAVVGGTLLTAFLEWLLFELIRTPYRPPHDMLTFSPGRLGRMPAQTEGPVGTPEHAR